MTLSDHIQAVLQTKAKALVDKSSAMLSEITDPAFVYVTSRGTRVDRDAYIARVCAATDWRFGSQTVENLQVVDFETFAVATMILHDEFVHAGGTIARTYQSCACSDGPGRRGSGWRARPWRPKPVREPSLDLRPRNGRFRP
jgi:hypothetical protein